MKPIIANATYNMLAKKERPNKYAVPHYKLDINNSSDSHSILAKNALGSKEVLDVGCGVGYIGSSLKSLQKCSVTGIELDDKAARIAAKTYDEMLVMKFGDDSDSYFQSFLRSRKKYDCIICGDIIEHLVDPGYALYVLSKKLARDGKILVSVPNLAHIDIIAGLMDGKFNYATSGLLDSTHLRFWTENSFYDFIKNINERYGVTLFPRLLGRTYVESPNYDSSVFRQICGDDCLVFQNIFELSLSADSFPKNKKHCNYQNLTNDIIETKKTVRLLEEKINNMENSLSWKITSPLRKLNARIKIKR